MKSLWKQVLKSMGYREMSPNTGIWGKPIGFGLLVYTRKDDKISSHFKSLKGEFLCYSCCVSLFPSQIQEDREAMYLALKESEAQACSGLPTNLPSEFQFLTLAEAGVFD